MQQVDEYNSLSSNSTGEYREKGSKFLAFAYPVKNIEQIDRILVSLRAEHSKANHVCYAYALGIDRDQNRANDDGEPSGTAGKPIYNTLLSQSLTDTLVAVVRYFGGTKLGTSGLIKAYKESAKLAIEQNTIVVKYLHENYILDFDYSIMGDLLNNIKSVGLEIIDKKLEESASVTISVRKSISSKLLNKLKAKMLNIEEERITDKTEVSGLKISLC